MTVVTAPGALIDPIEARRSEIRRIATAAAARRQLYSKIGLLVCGSCIVVALVPLISVIAYTIERGVHAWSVDFFTKLPTPEGIPGGGVWNAIVGSLIIDGMAAAAAIPFGVLGGLFLAESDGRFAAGIRFATDVFSGVPSIVLGIFAYIMLVKTLGHFSAIAASFAIATLMLPVIMRASETAIRSVPHSLREAGLSLGARNVTVASRIIVPGALPGLITGVLLALARGIGETAPLILTTIDTQYFSSSPFKPIAALPLVAYDGGLSAYADLQQRAWGTALFLVLVVLVLSVGSRLVAARIRRVRR
jgi:phosphate transport system permease protein